MKAEMTKLKDPVRMANKSGMSEAAWALQNRTRRMGMPAKTVKVESELVKFEEEFLRQREKARQQKLSDDSRYQDAVQRFRQERITNLRTNHEYMKEWEQHLNTLWKHSKVTMAEVKDSQIKFRGKMTDNIRTAEDMRSEAARADFENGIKSFEDNANRLGVELDKDPNHTTKVEKAPFNFHALMQKVREKSELNEISRKQKESRERYITLKQAKMREEVEKQNTMKSKISKYMNYSQIHKGESEKSFVVKDKENFIAAQRERQYLERKAKNTNHMEQIIKNLKTMTDEEYKKKNEEIRFIKQVHMLKERTKEYQAHYQMCNQVMHSLFELSDACYEKLPKNESGETLPYGQINHDTFKELLRRFMNQETLYDEAPEQAELKSTILTYSKLVNNDNAEVVEQALKNYLGSASSFRVPLTYNIFMAAKEALIYQNPTLIKILLDLVDVVFPIRQKPQFPIESPSFLPIRIAIVGKPFSGKKTLASRLSATLGVPIIDLNKIIEKAKLLVKPEEPEDGAEEGDKKAPAKKVAPPAKGKKEAHVQLTEEEVELQRYGVKLRNMEILKHEVPDSLKVELIMWSLRNLVTEKKYSEIKAAYVAAKEAHEHKLANPKEEKKVEKAKPATKGKDQKTHGKEEDDAEPTFQEQFPYHQGFILVGFPETQEQAL